MHNGVSRVDWDDAARDLVARVKQEAMYVGDDYLGTTHLLMAAVACTTVEGFPSLTLETVRAAVIKLRDVDADDRRVITPWCQTPRFKRALETAMDLARIASRPVNCLDIWCGLFDDPESECIPVLRYLGIDPGGLMEFQTKRPT